MTTLSQQRGGSGRGSRLVGALPARPARRAAESQASGEGGCAAGSGKAEWVEARVSGHAPEPRRGAAPASTPRNASRDGGPRGAAVVAKPVPGDPGPERSRRPGSSGPAGVGGAPPSVAPLPRSRLFYSKATVPAHKLSPDLSTWFGSPPASRARVRGSGWPTPPGRRECPVEGWGSVPRGKHTPKPASEGSRVQALGEARWDKLGKPDRAMLPGPYASLQSDPQHAPAATPGRRSSDPVPASPSRGPPKAS
ncbi:translation initiation factor IF-2-like [Psammomys obesus]|uniref:translation initiation factor IF-2-like n=1 Tax=Psammomys obesus TaxID=48139 RepID=UPI0024531740|nr:translation initiation factor IF-2-like [Psammomys obesus]XP_055476898.1 translation initiation factor IF-2-like [Psammomys obesus]